jgi:hypothetical protein
MLAAHFSQQYSFAAPTVPLNRFLLATAFSSSEARAFLAGLAQLSFTGARKTL